VAIPHPREKLDNFAVKTAAMARNVTDDRIKNAE
jgi:hypothetical protein